MPKRQHSPHVVALAAAVGYLVFGVVWVLGSDAAVELVAHSTSELTRLQNVKGWAFVGISAVLAYLLVRGVIWRDARLRTSARHLATTTHYAPVGIALLDSERRCIEVNPELARLLDMPAERLEGERLDNLLGLDEHGWAAAEGVAQEVRAPHATKGTQWLRLRHACVNEHPEAGESARIALIDDVTLQHTLESRQRLAAVAFESRQPTLITDTRGTILHANRACLDLYGYTSEEVLGKNPRIFASGMQDGRFYAAMWQQLADKGYWEGELVNRRRDGSLFPQWQSITAVRAVDGTITHYVAHATDLSERREIERTLHQLENYDPLTGLPNRSHFLACIDERLKAGATGMPCCLLLLDLDGFRRINDGFGPARGDAVLRETAELLTRLQPQTERCARISADVFGLLLDLDNTQALAMSATLRDGLAAMPSSAMLHYPITACVGFAALDGEGDALVQLARAETALHYAKQEGPATALEYRPEMQSAAEARLTVASQLQRALARGHIVPFLQPQCDGDGHVVGGEALARWVKPDGKLVPPGEFIPLAEELGLIGRIGERMLQGVAELGAKLEREGRPMQLAVNVSAQHMREPDFVERTLQIVQAAGVSPQRITLEITESLVIEDFAHAAARLDTLREHGFRISIDDFGTGYSSLSYLRQLPIDELKIDGSFLRQAMADRTGELLFEAVVGIGHTLGLLVVAEGVETAEQAALARRSGKVLLQGFLYGAAIPMDRFAALVSDPAPLPR